VSFQGAFRIAAAVLLGALALSLARLRMRRSAVDPARPAAGRRQEPHESPSMPRLQMIAACLVMGLVGASVSTFLPFLALYVRHQLDAAAFLVGLTFALFSIARFTAGLSVSRVADVISRRLPPRSRLISMLIVAAALLAGQSVHNLPVFLLLGIALAFVLTITNILVMASTASLAPRRLASSIGLLEACALGGAIVGPSVGGVIYSTDPRLLFLGAGGVALLAAVASLAAPPPHLSEG
jgi:MFS family permease